MVSAAVALLAALTVLAGCVGWIVRDRAARQAKWTADLQAALGEAQRFQEEGWWPQAQAAARRAEILLQDGTAEPALAERVKSLLRELAEQEADVRLVARLEEIRLRQADVKDNGFVLNRSRAEYQRAFETYGLRMDETTPEQAAAVLRRRPPSVRGTLLAALDHWSILARHEKVPEAGWLKQVLSAADSDPWRQGVRAAREDNDRQEMEKLRAKSTSPSSRPKPCSSWKWVSLSEVPPKRRWRSCDAPSRLSRETSGSTTTWAWNWAIATRHSMRRPFDS